MAKYNHTEIENKWQDVWAKTKLFETDLTSKKPKFYNLVMFPYPSGAYLHMGHGYSYSGADVYARWKKLNGFNVFEPIGFDSFGLPAENYAIKMGVHPAESTKLNIQHAEEQLHSFGTMFDFSKTLATSDPSYYKWTQWLFLKLFEQRLAYQKEAPVNWCPKCLTVLANEQVVNELCERCETEVVRKSMKQWFFKITDYADRLVKDLDKVDWPESSKLKQRNWIGRSEGTEVEFAITTSVIPAKAGIQDSEILKQVQDDTGERLTVFTTRIDTIFGATYMVVAPEHSLIKNLKDKIQNFSEVEKYVAKAAKKSDLERTSTQKDKTGVELIGIKAVNPFNHKEIPVFVADYIVGGYGTGAIMAVPAHDERDFAFAEKFKLPVRDVIEPVFVNNSGNDDTFRSDAPISERNAVVAIVKHWSEDKFLGIQWTASDWQGFNTGGIEKGQNAVQAGMVEITEEVGYKNIELVQDYGKTIHSKFFQLAKSENRFAHFHPVLYKLRDGEKTKIAEHEEALHKEVWLTPVEMSKFLNRDDMRWIWDGVVAEKQFTGYGILADSGEYSGLTSEEAQKKMIAWIEAQKLGGAKTNYRLRDWSFSRQRYWGAPIPIVHCPKCGTVPVPEKDLPVLLPEVDIKMVKPMGTGKSPLANVSEFVNTTCPKCGGKAERETDTMDTFVCSSFYFLRYPNVGDDTQMMNPEITKKWLPVDMYVGGAEHVTMHLLYSRFVTKALFDAKLITFDEPFTHLRHQGMILGPDGKKMSKSKGNVVIPDEIIREYGADIFRTYILFMGPFEDGGPWNPKGIVGVRRFFEKIYDSAQEKNWPANTSVTVEVQLNKLIKKVTADVADFKFNTAIASFMGFVNTLAENKNEISKVDFERFLILLNPFAPHLTEELWEKLGNTDSICIASWPTFDEKLTVDELITIAVQVNGKVRDSLLVSAEVTEEEVFEMANKSEKIQKYIAGKEIKKQIYIKGKILSIVTS